MNIIPAIDLYEGKVVRLIKGDYSKMKIYSDSPLTVAMKFEKAGINTLHLVDLEGAISDTVVNMDSIEDNYIVLPLHTHMTEENVNYVCEVIKKGW